MAKDYIIKLEEKTEVKRLDQDLKEEICYYTTVDGMFVPGSLSFDNAVALKFYNLYVERNGTLETIRTLEETTISK
jgi:hypothetical protein